MPRAGPRKIRRSTPRPIGTDTEAQERELLALLGYDNESTLEDKRAQRNVLREVWILFEKYRLDCALIDATPTPAYIRDQLTLVIKKVDQLRSTLSLSDEATREHLTSWLTEGGRLEVPDVEAILDSLRCAAGSAVTGIADAESRGAPTNAALKQLVSGLRIFFERECVGALQTERGPTMGRSKPLSPHERATRAFVKYALESEKIALPRELGRSMRTANTRREAEDTAKKGT